MTTSDINSQLTYQNSNVLYNHRHQLVQTSQSGTYIIHLKAGVYENSVKGIKKILGF